MKKIIINVVVFFVALLGAGVFAVVMQKISPRTPDSYCVTLAKEIVKMTSDKETKFVTIENAKDEKKRAPVSLELPGILLRSCSGMAYVESGDKMPIFFYETRKEGTISDHFIGYEEH